MGEHADESDAGQHDDDRTRAESDAISSAFTAASALLCLCSPLPRTAMSAPASSSAPTATAVDNTSFPKSKIKVLLLERISAAAQQIFLNEGYQVEAVDKLGSEEALIAKIADVHAIGIRSKTNLNANVLKHAKKLLTIGCFCIGTDQTDLEAASFNGTCVFNVSGTTGKEATTRCLAIC